MKTLLHADWKKQPELFRFPGAIPKEKMDAWLKKRNLSVPQDLKDFWCETGGGELFETETILSPFGRRDLGDDVDSINQFHRQKGMPADWLVFHTGLGGLSVIELSSGKYASVHEGTYEVHQKFETFADWYDNFIRREYAPRYGLSE